MSDRCYVKLILHGHIPSMRALVAIAKAIVDDGLTDELDANTRDIVRFMADCLATGDNPDFTDCESNYGSIEDTEATLQKWGVAYCVDQGGGGEYGPEERVWMPGMESKTVVETDNDGCVVVDAHFIQYKLTDEGKDAALAYLDSLLVADKLPSFSAAEPVERYLLRQVAVDALKVA